MKFNIIFTLFIISLMSCGAQPAERKADVTSHQVWSDLLHDHVREDGMVDYKGFLQDLDKLDQYLADLSAGAPDPENWSRDEQLAYWINAYNAFTVKLIVDNYPLESIKDLNPVVAIPTVSTIWNKKFFTIGGVEMSLDNIEHDILRKDFKEPRIHFAINCASVSCPPLRREAYVADQIDDQLEEQAIVFLNDPLRNQISPDNPKVSKIFSWFSGDFKKNGTVIQFINQYSETKINPGADLDFMDYNWALNDTSTR